MHNTIHDEKMYMYILHTHTHTHTKVNRRTDQYGHSWS